MSAPNVMPWLTKVIVPHMYCRSDSGAELQSNIGESWAWAASKYVQFIMQSPSGWAVYPKKHLAAWADLSAVNNRTA
jgi:hypothetical protein